MQRRQAGRKKQMDRSTDRKMRLEQAGETGLKENTKWTGIQEDRQKGVVSSVCRLERTQKQTGRDMKRRQEK